MLLAVMGAVTVYALSQRSEARAQAREAKANELVASADAELEATRSSASCSQLDAARLAPGETRGAGVAARGAPQSRVRGGVDIGTPLLSAAFRRDEVVAVTEGGDVVRTKPASSEVVASRFATGVNGRVGVLRERRDGARHRTRRAGAARGDAGGVMSARSPGVSAAPVRRSLRTRHVRW